MTQCSHYYSATGKRCRAEATTEIRCKIDAIIQGDKNWRVQVCDTHALPYTLGNYIVKQLAGAQ